MVKKVRAGLRLSEELNRRTAEEARRLEISKNDFILLAIQEKLRREEEKTTLIVKEGSPCQ